jgi:hypothetical protein
MSHNIYIICIFCILYVRTYMYSVENFQKNDEKDPFLIFFGSGETMCGAA